MNAPEAQLLTSEAELRLIADNVPAFILRLDTRLHYEFVNRAYAARFGMQPDQLVGRSLESVIGPEAFAITRPHLERVLNGESIEYESIVPYAHLGECFMRSSNVAVRDATGEVVGLIGVLTDLTERKRIEDALRDADRKKDEFLATLAHELRNPLNAISHAVELLNVAGCQDSRAQRAQGIIRRQLDHTVRLIDDLLEIGRITSGKIQLQRQPVALVDIVAQGIESAHAQVERRGLDLRVASSPAPVIVDGDRVRLAQVVANLLDNGCKFTPQGGRIEIAAGRDGTHGVIRIRDSGIGIATSDLTRVFEMFAQVESPLKGPQQGLGIGLSLSRGIVALHGGSIEALSEGIGQGSEFIVRLPLASSDPAPIVAAPRLNAGAGPQHPRRILVVDDNVDNAETICALLRSVGHVVETAYDGVSALDQARAFVPDAVLLDIGLPTLDGHDVCRALRESERGKQVLIVAMTGLGQAEDRERSRASGFDVHLVKPVRLHTIAEVLNRAF